MNKVKIKKKYEYNKILFKNGRKFIIAISTSSFLTSCIIHTRNIDLTSQYTIHLTLIRFKI